MTPKISYLKSANKLKIMFRAVEKIKKFVEKKRASKNLFWRGLVLIKDALWFLWETISKIAYLPFGLCDVFDYLFLEPPIISSKSYIFLAGPKTFSEFKGGVYNPGSIDYGKDIILLGRAEKYPHKMLMEKQKYFSKTCSPVLIFFDKKSCNQIIKVDYPEKDSRREEDFRIFKFKNKIYSNFSVTTWNPDIFFPEIDPSLLKRRMLVGQLDLKKLKLNNISPVKIDLSLKNWEKNWVFFQNEADLYLIYSFSPFYRLLRMDNLNPWKFKTIISKKIRLPFKNTRNKFISLSTNPVEYDKNHFLLLVHLKNHDSYSYKFWGVLIDKKSLLPKKITSRPIFRSYGLLPRSPRQIVYVSSVTKKDNLFIFFIGKGDKEAFWTSIDKNLLDKFWIDIK